MLRLFYGISFAVFAAVALIALAWPPVLWSLLVLVPLFTVGVWDGVQSSHAVLRNFPLIGHLRYFFELIRPEMYQYFIESETDGMPFSREHRSIVYQRAKGDLATLPFGTQMDPYAEGYEWIGHSLSACTAGPAPRIPIGAESCKQPYQASMLNISAMSYGSLSAPAIRALNGGAALGGFYHNTGEGGISPHHLEPGGDLVWQVGTGYFGCRSKDGGFDREAFRERAAIDPVKMVELKLSQGAKPGHGGILPAGKITEEIAAIRGVGRDADVVSPPSHSAFQTSWQMMEFLAELRDLSGGKPVGFKLCIGDPPEFLALVRAMVETGNLPDFITVDGGEGGTGAAPLEFSNSVGWPLTEALMFVHNSLVGFGVRERIKVIASGKIITGFHMAKRLAVGADLCNSARGMMFALGCIQARRCHANSCPVGVATHEPGLVRGLVPEAKAPRVARFQHDTVHALMELLGAAGIEYPDLLRPWHIHRRISYLETRTFDRIYDYLEPGALLESRWPAPFDMWQRGLDL